MTRRSVPLWLLLLAGGAIMIALLTGGQQSTATPGVTPPSVAPSASPRPKSCKPQAAIAAALGVKRDDLRFGKDVGWDRAPEAEPMNAFSHAELSSKGKLTSYLNGDSIGSRQARKLLDDALSSKQYDRALAGKGWTPVQLKGEATVSLPGNYQLLDRKVVKRGSVSQPGEVLWVYVPTGCSGSKVPALHAAVRAWCGNPVLFARE